MLIIFDHCLLSQVRIDMKFVLDLADRRSLNVTNNFVMQLGLDHSFIVFVTEHTAAM